MDYSCPSCKRSLKSKLLKFDFYKSKTYFFGFWFSFKCPFCLSLIEQNQHKAFNIPKIISMTLLYVVTFFFMKNYRYLTSSILHYLFFSLFFISIYSIIVLSVHRYFSSKISSDWVLWKLHEKKP